MRIISYIGMILIILFLPLWVFVLATCLYALTYNAYELIPLAVVVDALFGDPSRSDWYWYTTVTLLAVLLASLLKPYLRFY